MSDTDQLYEAFDDQTLLVPPADIAVPDDGTQEEEPPDPVDLLFDELRRREHQAIVSPAQFSASRTIPTIERGGSTVLENVLPLRHILENEHGTISLVKVRSLVVKMRRKIIRKLKEMGITAQKPAIMNQYWQVIEEACSEVFQSSIAEDQQRDHRLQQYVQMLLDGVPLLEITQKMQEAGLTSEEYVRLFVETGRVTRMQADNVYPGYVGKHGSTAPHHDGISDNGKPKSRIPKILDGNDANNYLRIPGILNQVEYDTLHQSGMYNFTTRETPNIFAHVVSDYTNGNGKHAVRLVEGKEVLTFGPGNGSDEMLFIEEGAKRVDMVEVSPHMIGRLNQRREELDEPDRERYVVPEKPSDMLQALMTMDENDERQFDLVYGHSVFHYFDDETLHVLFSLIHRRLRPGGHLAFAVKAPNVWLDNAQSETCLINDTERLVSERGPAENIVQKTRCRMFFNLDGQTRAFRDSAVWVELLKAAGFSVQQVTEQVVDDFDTEGEQTFYYFICRKNGAPS